MAHETVIPSSLAQKPSGQGGDQGEVVGSIMPGPRELLERQNMSPLQIGAVAMAIALNALDGFDVLAISFAAPGIAQEWSTTQAGLGVVLALELIGMVIGSLVLGGAADRLGRRPLLLSCLALMTIGMALASTATTVFQLAVWRVLTGLGVGGMVATLNAIVAEFSNARRRNLAVSLMVVGYPTGAVVGGSIAALLLASSDWRSVFQLGAVVTLLMIPLVWFLVPESVSYLLDKRPRNALRTLNRTLARMQIAPLAVLPTLPDVPGGVTPIVQILAKGRVAGTLLVTAAYLGHIVTFYFVLKWTAKLVVDMGFDPSAAASVLVWVNVGGIVGGGLVGLASQRVSLKLLTILVLVGSFLSVWWFGNVSGDLWHISVAAAVAGAFVNSGVSGLYAILAQVFPSSVRATGTGFAVGVGRAGAILSPIIAGLFLDQGWKLGSVALVMGLGSLVGALALFKLAVPETRLRME